MAGQNLCAPASILNGGGGRAPTATNGLAIRLSARRHVLSRNPRVENEVSPPEAPYDRRHLPWLCDRRAAFGAGGWFLWRPPSTVGIVDPPFGGAGSRKHLGIATRAPLHTGDGLMSRTHVIMKCNDAGEIERLGEAERSGATRLEANPWSSMALFPTAEEEAGLPWPFRTPTFAGPLVSLFIGVAQIGLWRTVSPSQFVQRRGAVFRVRLASIGRSLDSCHDSHACDGRTIAYRDNSSGAGTRLPFLLDRAIIGVSGGSSRLFSPRLRLCSLCSEALVPIQADAGNAGVSAFLGTLLSGVDLPSGVPRHR